MTMYYGLTGTDVYDGDFLPTQFEKLLLEENLMLYSFTNFKALSMY